MVVDVLRAWVDLDGQGSVSVEELDEKGEAVVGRELNVAEGIGAEFGDDFKEGTTGVWAVCDGAFVTG